jgi:hypothetical protein
MAFGMFIMTCLSDCIPSRCRCCVDTVKDIRAVEVTRELASDHFDSQSPRAEMPGIESDGLSSIEPLALSVAVAVK